MRKIPTVFVRDEDTNRRHVKNVVSPGCEWVLAGEGIATRKFDGSCVLVRDDRLWRRREVKVDVVPDEVTAGVLTFPEGMGAEEVLAKLVAANGRSRLVSGPGIALVPDEFDAVSYDPTTRKVVGWIPVGAGPEDKIHREAFESGRAWGGEPFVNGQTYELVGPKVNGNPDGFTWHVLIRHGFTTVQAVPRDFDGLREWMSNTLYEGIVWHHPDGRMAKLKRRDFPKVDQ